MRAKEFLMKDCYSFDKSIEDAYESYNLLYQAYCNIFKRLQLNYIAVEADTGNIGGTKSHEFQIVSETGEDILVQCECGNYAANIEKAIGKHSKSEEKEMINLELFNEDDQIFYIGLITSKGRKPNLIKLKSHYKVKEVKINEKKNEKTSFIIYDKSVYPQGEDYFTHAMESDICTSCNQKSLEFKKGIEVGHVFYLGTKYSDVLNANFKNQEGKILPTEMGCYGIGVSRVLQSIVETSNDENGIIWPLSVSPFKICIIPSKNQYLDESLKLSKEIEEINGWKNDVLFDDRLSVGQSLKECFSLGIHFILVMGKHYESEQKFELIVRKSSEKKLMNREELISFFKNLIF